MGNLSDSKEERAVDGGKSEAKACEKEEEVGGNTGDEDNEVESEETEEVRELGDERSD